MVHYCTARWDTFTPPFTAIRDWRLVGSPDGTAIGAAEELIESLGELAVPVMDQEPQVYPFLLSPHAYIPGLLLHPLIVRVEA